MMAPMVLPRADPAGLHTVEPLAGTVMSVIICLVSISIISGFIVVLLIYLDSYLFVFVTAVLQFALGVNTNIQICDGAILLCLHIIRGATKPRLKSKLYIFNSFGMLGVYAVIAILNFIFRITRIDDGQCYIGMQKVSMIPLISFDAVVNVYLTILFLIPLKSLYSFKNFPKTPANVRLRTVALRTFVGALCTLTSSIVNLTVLMALDGEPGWVCLMCCNSDILFSAVVVQWVTNKDNAATQGSSGGASRSNDANPFVVDDFRGGPEGGYSPHIAPSQKHVMDDMGEISLDSGTRSEFANSDKGSSEAERQRHASSASTIPSTGAVMVTTTIKRESKPGPALFEEMQIEDGYTAPPSNASSRPMSGRDQEFDNYTRGSRTKITAGKR
ncbi:hypothetical protein K4K49_002293 [Colletotrichum sp. SAR 10_70]|nr:hypothetical protein K4K50_008266 [Colletotrichum sp. SAR 10_71]KAI8158428.1 hypothetical protein KHU50_009189 [Colletotrichum sp. SAR 10_65]KAI8176894.1 hypothetical protein K4K49_002293 [Colletotrichum sp. SAR 10_70]KAI8180179.1 hypothetical protein K4K51_002890 [Colletotrichum sp. SAR 10_75]KAI8200262.1 hypothetical protein K4K52_008114 [Colletotrichum sp. SAR 10_76]KAI8217069.1 hypothetical protein K4K53_009503 [Colletotrichum sp. SAR 10_77]KAI8219438.1 hypothetical protein K4K54_00947